MDSATLSLENIVDSQIDVNSIFAETLENEPNSPEESVEELLERAAAQLLSVEMENNLRSQKPATTPALVIHTIDEAQDLPIVEVTSSNAQAESDDEVIFVGEVGRGAPNVVINLCSPVTNRSQSRILTDNTNPQNVQATAKTTTNRLKKNSNLAVSSTPDSDKNTVICAICMDSSVGRKPHSTTCGHIFCGDCIKQAIKVMKKCPLCNKSLNQKNIIPVFI